MMCNRAPLGARLFCAFENIELIALICHKSETWHSSSCLPLSPFLGNSRAYLVLLCIPRRADKATCKICNTLNVKELIN